MACRFKPHASPSGVCHLPMSFTRTLHIQFAYLGGASTVRRSLSKTFTCLTLILHLSQARVEQAALFREHVFLVLQKGDHAGVFQLEVHVLAVAVLHEGRGLPGYANVQEPHLDRIARRDVH